MGYSREALKGVGWMWALRLVTRSFSFLRVAVIARLLTPTLFGFYGIASLVLSFVEVFTESGINILIIQGNEDIKKIINTAWVVSIIRGFIIFLVIIISIPVVTYFFNTPEAGRLVFLISIVPLLRGFINPAIVRFQKDLKFKSEFYFRSVIFAIESVFSILLVYITGDPAGIIYGLIIGAGFEILLSFIFVHPTPRLEVNRDQMRMIFSRGKWLTAGGIFNYLYHNADDAVVGRVLGAASLGIYDMSYRVSMLPITEIGETVSKVIFPVYAKIADDRKRLMRAFTRTMLGVSVFILPVGFAFYVLAEPIIRILLGSQWLDAVPVFRALAVFGVIRTYVNPIFSVYLSVKKQKYNTIVSFVSFAVMLVTIIPLISAYGLLGAGIAVVLGSLLSLPLAVYFLYLIFYKK